MTPLPILLVLVHDQKLGEAIAASAEGFDVRWSLDFPRDVARDDARDVAAAVAQIADMHPALLVIELDTPARWLARVRSDPATRRVPVIAITNDDPARKRAAEARPTLTLTPSEFTARLPGILTENANIFAHAALLQQQ